MIKINLLPVRELRKKEEIRNHFIAVGVMVVVTAGIMVYMNTSINARIDRLQKDIKRTEEEIKRLDQKIGEVNKIKQIKQDLENKLKVIKKLNANRNFTVHLLDELAKAIPVDPTKKIPRKIQLETFEVKGSQVKIKGISLDEASVSAFANNLEASPYYKGVQIKSLKKTIKKKIKAYEFEFLAFSETPRPTGRAR